jgi:phage/plasmid-associated DNA primase
VGSNFKWDQTEFQSCTALEYVSISKKHSTAFSYYWRSHITLAGNAFPDTWKDTKNNLGRRLATVNFDKHVPDKDSDPEMPKKLYLETPYLIQKIVKCYLFACFENKSKNFWEWCPEYFKIVNKKIIQNANPLVAFLEDPEKVETTDKSWPKRETIIDENGIEKEKVTEIIVKPYCKKLEFFVVYKQYLLEIQYPKKETFSQQYYESTFSKKGIKIMRMKKDWDEAGVPEDYRPKEIAEYFYGLKVHTAIMDNTFNNSNKPQSKEMGRHQAGRE